jgi:ATP-dependent RNA helicase SUPV3L1/SUV3
VHGRTLRAAAARGLEGEFTRRARHLAESADVDLTLSEHGRIWWDGAIVARLTAGQSALEPVVQLLADDQLRGPLRDTVRARLSDFVAARIADKLAPLLLLRDAIAAKPGSENALPAQVRGLAYQLCENLGSLMRSRITLDDIRPVIRALRPYGVRFGQQTIYLPALLKPDAARLLHLLRGLADRLEQLPPPPAPGITSFAVERDQSHVLLQAAGFRVAGAPSASICWSGFARSWTPLQPPAPRPTWCAPNWCPSSAAIVRASKACWPFWAGTTWRFKAIRPSRFSAAG